MGRLGGGGCGGIAECCVTSGGDNEGVECVEQPGTCRHELEQRAHAASDALVVELLETLEHVEGVRIARNQTTRQRALHLRIDGACRATRKQHTSATVAAVAAVVVVACCVGEEEASGRDDVLVGRQGSRAERDRVSGRQRLDGQRRHAVDAQCAQQLRVVGRTQQFILEKIEFISKYLVFLYFFYFFIYIFFSFNLIVSF